MRDEKLYRNIKTLAKMKGMKLGEIEHSVGLSVGYFSRHKALSSNTLIALSDILECSIDELIKSDFVDEYERKRILSDVNNALETASAIFSKDALMKEIVQTLNRCYD